MEMERWKVVCLRCGISECIVVDVEQLQEVIMPKDWPLKRRDEVEWRFMSPKKKRLRS